MGILPSECGSLLPLLSFEFKVSSSQLKIAGQPGTQNWKLGILKSGSKLPHSEGALRAQKARGIRRDAGAPGALVRRLKLLQDTIIV